MTTHNFLFFVLSHWGEGGLPVGVKCMRLGILYEHNVGH